MILGEIFKEKSSFDTIKYYKVTAQVQTERGNMISTRKS